MKSIIRLFIILMFLISACWAGQLRSNWLLIYRDPLTAYPEMFDVSGKVGENRFQATFLLPNGRSSQREKAGIVAILHYPPEIISPEVATEATSTIQQVVPLITQFPKFKGTLEAFRNKWQNTLVVANQMKAAQPTPKPTPAAETISFTTIADGLGVMSDSGIQRIPFDQLPKDLQERFHYEPKKVVALPTASPQPKPRSEAKAQQEEETQAEGEKEVQVLRERELQAQKDKFAQVEQEKNTKGKYHVAPAQSGNMKSMILNALIDLEKAEKLKQLQESAEKGDPKAQYNLGVFYENGRGVAKSEIEAVKWYRQAAENGEAGAQYNLGICCLKGKALNKMKKRLLGGIKKPQIKEIQAHNIILVFAMQMALKWHETNI